MYFSLNVRCISIKFGRPYFSVFETVFQEAREALEDPKTSNSFYSPCGREPPMALPPSHCVLCGTRGRCTEARAADGTAHLRDAEFGLRPAADAQPLQGVERAGLPETSEPCTFIKANLAFWAATASEPDLQTR